MPSTGNQATVDTFLRQLRVRMVRQRDKALAEVDDFLLLDSDGAELVHRPGDVVFKIAVVRGGGEWRFVHGAA